jgi:hypothetical protein
MADDDPELLYYRQVEDLFSSLRGAPHILSPRDFQLLRTWWREEVPLAAISAGLTEVFARQREREDADPVVSLSYCRHAVKKHAKELAALHVGRAQSPDRPASPDGAARELTARLHEAERRLASDRPAVAEILGRTREQVEAAARELPPEQLDEHLFELESTMLAACWDAVSESERTAIDERAKAAASAAAATDDARRRSIRALRDRAIRDLLRLPRLDLLG